MKKNILYQVKKIEKITININEGNINNVLENKFWQKVIVELDKKDKEKKFKFQWFSQNNSILKEILNLS